MYWFIIKIAIVYLSQRLWRMGGSSKYPKSWRRVVLPILPAWFFAWQEPSLGAGILTYVILHAGLYGISSMGYGIPSPGDEGSFMGRLFKTEYMTRGILGILYSLPFLRVLSWDLMGMGAYIWINFTCGFAGSIAWIKAERYERLIGLGVGTVVFL